ncbi:phosphatidate cytidylyltransferase [Aliikangiella sp. IMCC44359]|uniref:phosphatidate cytidylyltransferase n=1 Tax=Aliikangiella sp. IMCC44359 TaxID=3459125 RepID=UPI00403B36AF
MLKQRIITALILLPLVLGLILKVQLNYFAGVIAAVVYLLALEWGKLAGFKHHYQNTIYALVVAVIVLTTWYLADQLVMWPSPSWPFALVWDYPMIVLALGLLVIVCSLVVVLGYSWLPKWWSNQTVLLLFGIFLLPAFFVSFISIRSVSYLADFYRGGYFLILMFCLVWAADTGAFIAGKLLGKHKLAPIVSPNKTWEGAIGGFVFSFAIAWIGVYLIGFDVENAVVYSAIAVLLAIFSVLGDLFESAMKRVANIKDSGNLLPGHGGLLDRLDSTIVVAPLFFLTFSYFGWFR